jgi:hypothetical protein
MSVLSPISKVKSRRSRPLAWTSIRGKIKFSTVLGAPIEEDAVIEKIVYKLMERIG